VDACFEDLELGELRFVYCDSKAFFSIRLFVFDLRMCLKLFGLCYMQKLNIVDKLYTVFTKISAFCFYRASHRA